MRPVSDIIWVMFARLGLFDFRNYTEVEFDFEPGINVIWGKNAVGKTNMLEAICLLGTGESFRANMIDEMVRFGREMGRVSGRLVDAEEEKKLEIMVTKGVVAGQRTLKRKYFLDDTPKRKNDYLGSLPIVIFRPEDMDLLTGGPDLRRGFLDGVLCQTSETYGRSLTTYQQALRRRNKLLDLIREGLANRYSLTFWDGLLIKHGESISLGREKLIEFINNLWGRSELFNSLKLVYDKSVISEARLAQYKDEELAAGYTLVGPHKDEFRVLKNESESAVEGRDLGVYGSRGEQRMAVLALKLGEIYYNEDKLTDKPLLLLDDIFSELDDVHKKEVLRVMQGRQVVVTTANEDDLDLFGEAKVIKLG